MKSHITAVVIGEIFIMRKRGENNPSKSIIFIFSRPITANCSKGAAVLPHQQISCFSYFLLAPAPRQPQRLLLWIEACDQFHSPVLRDRTKYRLHSMPLIGSSDQRGPNQALSLLAPQKKTLLSHCIFKSEPARLRGSFRSVVPKPLQAVLFNLRVLVNSSTSMHFKSLKINAEHNIKPQNININLLLSNSSFNFLVFK